MYCTFHFLFTEINHCIIFSVMQPKRNSDVLKELNVTITINQKEKCSANVNRKIYRVPIANLNNLQNNNFGKQLLVTTLDVTK